MRRFRQALTLAALVLLVGGALMFAAADVQAKTITLVHDPFTDGSVNAGADPRDVTWIRNNTSGSLSVQSDATFGGNAMSWQTNEGFRGLTSSPFSSYVVGAPGYALQLTFDFRFAGGPPQTDGGLRFGLYNSQGTTGTNDDQGYYFSLSSGGNRNHGLYRETGGLSGIVAGTDRAQLGGNTTAPSLNDQNVHNMLMRLEYDAAGLRIIAGMDGIEYFNVLDTSPNRITEFDQIVFGNGNTVNLPLRFDNVTVTSVVPEPSTYALALFGGLGLGIAAWRKRRRAAAGRASVC